MKQIEFLNTKTEMMKLRKAGLPKFGRLEDLLGVITDIIDNKINELIEVVNEIDKKEKKEYNVNS